MRWRLNNLTLNTNSLLYSHWSSWSGYQLEYFLIMKKKASLFHMWKVKGSFILVIHYLKLFSIDSVWMYNARVSVSVCVWQILIVELKRNCSCDEPKATTQWTTWTSSLSSHSSVWSVRWCSAVVCLNDDAQWDCMCFTCLSFITPAETHTEMNTRPDARPRVFP